MNTVKVLIFSVILLLSVSQQGIAQKRRLSNSNAKNIVVFDSLCTSEDSFPKAKLRNAVNVTIKREEIEPSLADGKAAFSFDLNGDSKSEYFVPLFCGATGNCTWGVYSVNPTRLLGVINGKYIYIHKPGGKWRNISTYTHLAIDWGGVSTYRIRDGQLIRIAKYEVRANTERIPKFLEAEPICDPDLGSYDDKPRSTK